jgi:hypothetical protein
MLKPAMWRFSAACIDDIPAVIAVQPHRQERPHAGCRSVPAAQRKVLEGFDKIG